MKRKQVVELLQQSGLIAILRGNFDGKEVEIAHALIEGGIRLMEVSIVSANYKKVIERIATAFGDQIAIGAGTVLNLEQLAEVTGCGASFIVSPDSNDRVIEKTREFDCASFPGAFTPSEIVRARASGADAVKLFPASALGTGFVRALRGPLPDIKLIPTGGVHLHNLAEWFDAGAWAVAIGSELVDAKTIEAGDWNLLAGRARSFVRGAERGTDV